MNLLGPDLRAEVTVLVNQDWTWRGYYSKLDHAPAQTIARIAEAVIRCGIQFAKDHGYDIKPEALLALVGKQP